MPDYLSLNDIYDAPESPLVYRKWGYYEVLSEGRNWKVKRLIVNPLNSTSRQRHFKRKEYMKAVKGSGFVFVWDKDSDGYLSNHWVDDRYSLEAMVEVPTEHWHQIVNDTNGELEIIELQIGECFEEDIERA